MYAATFCFQMLLVDSPAKSHVTSVSISTSFNCRYNLPKKKGTANSNASSDPKPRRRDWKEQHLELVETIRASRQALMVKILIFLLYR